MSEHRFGEKLKQIVGFGKNIQVRVGLWKIRNQRPLIPDDN